MLWWKDLTCTSAIAYYCGLVCAPSLLTVSHELRAAQDYRLLTMTQSYSKFE